MKTPTIRLALSLAAGAALFATPALAAGVEEAVVPPSNSAATQYTEAFPTSSGDKKTDQATHHSSPDKVLGSHNTKKLEEQGPEGKAAAETAAATAPAPIETPAPAPVPKPTAHGNGNGNGGGDGNKGKSSPSAPRHQGKTGNSGKTVLAPAPAPEPAGSSGAGSAIGQATGLSTSGQSGILLPLVILATILWSLVYLWRQRRQVG
jgi:hypothetical protein